MRDLDDGPDGLNDAAFERALNGGRRRAARTRRSAPKVAKQPTLDDLKRAYRLAFARENKLVAALPEHAPPAQIAAAWRAAETTNAAMRALQAHHDDPSAAVVIQGVHEDSILDLCVSPARGMRGATGR